MIDTLQINKFSDLHDGKNIIFCKTDFLLQEFEYIKTLPNEVILISGNSDYVIDENIYKYKPDNVKSWYAQNLMIKKQNLYSLPIGLENCLPAKRDGHGVGWGERVLLKENAINNQKQVTPTKFIYSNFNISTNFQHRNYVKEACEKAQHIDWEPPTLSIQDFMNKMLEYEAVICPIGNGPDTHRFFEVLYMNRIPIVFDLMTYDNLHKEYPSIFINDIKQLKDYDFLKSKIEEEKNKIWDKEILCMNYWIQKIKTCI